MAKILLVEDDKSLREIYGTRLYAEGYDIVSAGDGEEALAMAIKERPQLIVSDVMMPKISGFDMLDILRSTTETKDIKVIMMTALSSEEQRQRGVTLGADRYLVKSQVGIEDVIRTVHEVLGDGEGAGDAPAADQPAAPATNDRPATPQVPARPTEQPTPAPAPTPQPAPAPEPAPAAPTPLPEPSPAPDPQPAAQPQVAPIPTPTPIAGPPNHQVSTDPMATPDPDAVDSNAPATSFTTAAPRSSLNRVIQPLSDPSVPEHDFSGAMSAALDSNTVPAPAAADEEPELVIPPADTPLPTPTAEPSPAPTQPQNPPSASATFGPPPSQPGA